MKTIITLKKVLLSGMLLSILVGYTQTPLPMWVNGYHSSEVSRGNNVATDPENNIISVLQLNGIAEIGPYETSGNNTTVHKVDPEGNIIWIKTWEDLGKMYVDTDNEGSVYLTGQFKDTVDFDPSEDVTEIDGKNISMYILKLNSDGDFQWVKSYTPDSIYIPESEYFESQFISPNAMTIDNNDDLIILGSFYGNMDFLPDGDSLHYYSESCMTTFFLKVNPLGEIEWTRILRHPSEDYLSLFTPTEVGTIKHDFNNNIFATVMPQYATDFDPEDEENILASTGRIFLLKLNSLGEFEWVQMSNGTYFLGGGSRREIAVDGDGSVYITGQILGETDLDPTEGEDIVSPSTPGAPVAYIRKIDIEGNHLWAVLFDNIDGFANYSDLYEITADMDNNIAIYGYSKYPLSLKDQSEEYITIDNGKFIANIDSNGNATFAFQIPGDYGVSDWDFGVPITFDLEGNLIFADNYVEINLDPVSNTPEFFLESEVESPFLAKFMWPSLNMTEQKQPDNLSFKAFPNPASGSVFIAGDLSEVTSIAVFDMTGRVQKEYLNNFDILNVSSLPKGFYLIKINTNDNYFLSQLVIK